VLFFASDLGVVPFGIPDLGVVGFFVEVPVLDKRSKTPDVDVFVVDVGVFGGESVDELSLRVVVVFEDGVRGVTVVDFVDVVVFDVDGVRFFTSLVVCVVVFVVLGVVAVVLGVVDVVLGVVELFEVVALRVVVEVVGVDVVVF